jgi:hypothetical protein
MLRLGKNSHRSINTPTIAIPAGNSQHIGKIIPNTKQAKIASANGKKKSSQSATIRNFCTCLPAMRNPISFSR